MELHTKCMFVILDVARDRTFVEAVFYIGKGQYSRPYEHLMAASKFLNPSKNTMQVSLTAQVPRNKLDMDLCKLWYHKALLILYLFDRIFNF